MFMSCLGSPRDRRRPWRSLPFAAVVTIAVLMPLAAARAQTRDLTSAERALVDRYGHVVGSVLDQFRNDDWLQKIDLTMDDPTTPVTPASPLQVGVIERTYNARPGSARWNAMIAPYATIVTGGQASPQAMAQAGKAMQPLLHVHVSATFNTRFSALDLKNGSELKVAGATLAFRDAHPTQYAESGVVLLFSGTETARWVRADGGLRFSFANPPGAVVIENAEIRISGAQDRVEELVRTIDWRQVNTVLGR